MDWFVYETLRVLLAFNGCHGTIDRRYGNPKLGCY